MNLSKYKFGLVLLFAILSAERLSCRAKASDSGRVSLKTNILFWFLFLISQRPLPGICLAAFSDNMIKYYAFALSWSSKLEVVIVRTRTVTGTRKLEQNNINLWVQFHKKCSQHRHYSWAETTSWYMTTSTDPGSYWCDYSIAKLCRAKWTLRPEVRQS